MSVNHFTVTVILFYLQNAANNDRILNSIFGISGKKLNKVSDMISSNGFYMFTGQSTLIMIAVYKETCGHKTVVCDEGYYHDKSQIPSQYVRPLRRK